jgi:hypothetical protein
VRAARGRMTHRPRPIVEVLVRMPPEILERRFVGVEEAARPS